MKIIYCGGKGFRHNAQLGVIVLPHSESKQNKSDKLRNIIECTADALPVFKSLLLNAGLNAPASQVEKNKVFMVCKKLTFSDHDIF